MKNHFLRYFATYGTPLKIKSDNGPPFNGEEFSNFSKIHGFKHRKLTLKHSQGNGEIENYMKQKRNQQQLQMCPKQITKQK